MKTEHSGNNVASDETSQMKNRNTGNSNAKTKKENESKDSNAGMTNFIEKMKPWIDKGIQLWVQTAPYRSYVCLFTHCLYFF